MHSAAVAPKLEKRAAGSMRFDCTTAAGLGDAIARTPRPLAMGRAGLLAALPEDLTHRVLGFLRLTRDNAQRFLGIVQRTQRAAEDIGREFRRQLENGNPHTFPYLTLRQALRNGLRPELCTFTEQIKESGTLLFVCKDFHRLFWKQPQSDRSLSEQCLPAAQSLVDIVAQSDERWDKICWGTSTFDAAFAVMRAIDPPSAMGNEALPAGRYYIRRVNGEDPEASLREGTKAPANYRNATGALLLDAPSGVAADNSVTIILKGVNKQNGEPHVPELTRASYVPTYVSESGSSFYLPRTDGVAACLTLRVAAACDANGVKILVGYYSLMDGETEWHETVRFFRASDETDDWPLGPPEGPPTTSPPG